MEEELPIISTKTMRMKRCGRCEKSRPIEFFATSKGKIHHACAYCLLDMVGELDHALRKKKMKAFDHIMEDKYYVFDTQRDSFFKLRNDICEDPFLCKYADEIRRNRSWANFIRVLRSHNVPFKIMIVGKKLAIKKRPSAKFIKKGKLLEIMSKNKRPSKNAHNNVKEVLKAVVNQDIDADFDFLLK